MPSRYQSPLLSLALTFALALPLSAQTKEQAKGGEPSFDNRPLSEWIVDLSGQAPYTRVAAAYAIASMGAEGKPAVPALLENLKSDNNTVRYSSALALGEIGPPAVEAVPGLEALKEDRNDDVAHMARKSIRRITGVD